MRHGLPVEKDGVLFGEGPLPAQQRRQLGLAVARDARDAGDLAGVDGEGDVPERHAERILGSGVQAPHFDARRGLRARGRAAGLGERGAGHQRRELGGRRHFRIGAAGDRAAPQDGGVVAERADLFELVADVEEAAPFRRDHAQGLEQALHGLGGEHRSRLVEDQQPGVLQEAAHDLDALALAHGEVAEEAAGVERQAVALRELADAGGERREIEGLVHRHRDVLRDGHRLEQREVLVHHADAELPGRRRARDPHRLAVPEDLAPIRGRRPVDDLHQGALAGPVLAEHGVDLPRHHGKRYAVVRHDAGEGLGDAAQFETWGHRARGPHRVPAPPRSGQGSVSPGGCRPCPRRTS